MAAESNKDFNKQRFISATMVSGLRRGFILQLCIFRLHCNFEEIRYFLVKFQPRFS